MLTPPAPLIDRWRRARAVLAARLRRHDLTRAEPAEPGDEGARLANHPRGA